MTANPHTGFRELIRRAKSGESEDVWDDLLERVLGELQAHAKRFEARHGTPAEALVTEAWLEISKRIDAFAEAKDDTATFEAFCRWTRGIQGRLAGVVRRDVGPASTQGRGTVANRTRHQTRKPNPGDEDKVGRTDHQRTSGKGTGRWVVWVLATVLLLLVLNIVWLKWFGH